jgi:hypothetical protein
MTLAEALDEIRKLGSIRLEDGKLKLDFPDSVRPAQVAEARAVVKASREAAIELLSREADAAPLADDDPEVWKAHPYRGEKGLDAWIHRMDQQRDWWKDHPRPIARRAGGTTSRRQPGADSDAGLFKSCSLCRGPLGDQPGSGYFVPPDDLNKRLGKPANTFIEVTLCSTCFARPDREAAMERSILDEHEGRATSADGSKLLRERRLR